VGGYPKPEPTSRVLEVPATGRRAWLERLAEEVTYGTAGASQVKAAPAPK
jgi:hypothetical protein